MFREGLQRKDAFFAIRSVQECHGRRQEATKEETLLLTRLVCVKKYTTYISTVSIII